MCYRAFCVSKFEFGTPPRERRASMCGIFCAMENHDGWFLFLKCFFKKKSGQFQTKTSSRVFNDRERKEEKLIFFPFFLVDQNKYLCIAL
jgi:hypothetical protein